MFSDNTLVERFDYIPSTVHFNKQSNIYDNCLKLTDNLLVLKN